MAGLTVAQKLAFADFHESYLSRYIALADTKAGVALTINAGLLGFIVTRAEWWSGTKAGPVALVVLMANGAIPLIAGAWSLWTIMPRRSPSSEGMIFWRSVRTHASESAFVSALGQLSSAQLADARLSHSWALAGVAQKKYDHLFWCLSLTGLAVMATVGHLLFSTLIAASPTAATPSKRPPAVAQPKPASPQSADPDQPAQGHVGR
jgi:Family of unknown function (DUF5706)